MLRWWRQSIVSYLKKSSSLPGTAKSNMGSLNISLFLMCQSAFNSAMLSNELIFIMKKNSWIHIYSTGSTLHMHTECMFNMAVCDLTVPGMSKLDTWTNTYPGWKIPPDYRIFLLVFIFLEIHKLWVKSGSIIKACRRIGKLSIWKGPPYMEKQILTSILTLHVSYLDQYDGWYEGFID